MGIYNTPGMGTFGSTWQAAGYSGAGNVEDLINSLRGRPAVVCGNAKGVFQEADIAIRYLHDPVIFGVNDAGMYLPKLDHWVSLHQDNLPAWKAVRWLQVHAEEKAVYHSASPGEAVDRVWEGLNPVFALSGYFAMQLAYLMGAGLIVLCGCPGSPMPRFFEAGPRDGFGYGGGTENADEGIRTQLLNEMKRVPDLREKVRSTSGWTRDYFGGL